VYKLLLIFTRTVGYHWYAWCECILAGNGASFEAVKIVFMNSVKCLTACNSCSQICHVHKSKSGRSRML